METACAPGRADRNSVYLRHRMPMGVPSRPAPIKTEPEDYDKDCIGLLGKEITCM